MRFAAASWIDAPFARAKTATTVSTVVALEARLRSLPLPGPERVRTAVETLATLVTETLLWLWRGYPLN